MDVTSWCYDDTRKSDRCQWEFEIQLFSVRAPLSSHHFSPTILNNEFIIHNEEEIDIYYTRVWLGYLIRLILKKFFIFALPTFTRYTHCNIFILNWYSCCMHLHRSRQTYGCAFRIVNATLHIYNSKGMNVSCNGISVSANVTVGTPWCSSRDNRYDIACCCEGSCPTYVPYGFNDIFGGNTLARSFILKEEMFCCEGSCMHDVQSISWFNSGNTRLHYNALILHSLPFVFHFEGRGARIWIV